MKKLSLSLLARTVVTRRKALKLTQAQLAKSTGMNRSVLSNLESRQYTPSIDQLQALAAELDFDVTEMFVEEAEPYTLSDFSADKAADIDPNRSYKIAVAGTGYVGLSLAVLLAQHNDVTAIDIVPEKVEKLNKFISPIQDEYIERYLREAKKGTRTLNLTATIDAASAYANADFIVIAAPTNYNPKTNYFDCSAVENVIQLVLETTSARLTKPTIVIKSTIPVGYTQSVRQKFNADNIIFSPEFLRESKALYDNLYPSRIIVGCEEGTEEAAHTFAALLRRGALKDPIETLFMGCTEAEATKLFVNTYLALRVSYFNELDTYAEIKGLKTASIIKGVCLDPRVGDYYNNPSFGYGGYCLPKDTKQLLSDYSGIPQSIISGIVRSNEIRKRYIAERIMEIAQKKTSKPVIGIYRLIMKSNSDNFRESAVLDVMEELTEKGAEILVYEPMLKSGLNGIGFERTDDLRAFKHRCTLIVANRYSEKDLRDVRDKVYTRDLYNRD